MPIFSSADVQFAYPGEWNDRSIVAFAAPPSEEWGMIPNFVMTRDTVGPEETISAYASRQLVEMARRLADFTLVDRTHVTLQGLAGDEMRVLWRGGQGMVQQRQTMLLDAHGTVYSFVATALQDDFPKVETTFELMLSSIRFPATV